MSDPKATKMTLEEAVEIIDTPTSMNDEAIARYTRARAIVDQAVQFVKEYGKDWDANANRSNVTFVEFTKLRALERGEREVQP